MPVIKRILLIYIFGCAAMSCTSGTITDEQMNGSSENAIIYKFGKPQKVSTVKLFSGEKLYEYQSNLYSLFPNLTRSDTVQIKELVWEFNDGDRMAIWFDKEHDVWVAIDNVKWSKDINF